MQQLTKTTPRIWHGSIIGFGTYHYEYASGRSGDAPAAAFAPRASSTVVYLPDGVGAHQDALQKLGPFAQVAADIRRSGRKPAARAFDSLIAATAKAARLPLYAFNADDLRAVAGLNIVALPPERGA